MREEIRIIPVGEVELFYQDVGPKDAPVIVTLPDRPGGSSHYLREFLSEELSDYRVIYLDPRGFGHSPPLPEDPRLFTIDAMVEDLEHLRHDLGLGPIIPFGQGFGALIALEYARRFPETARGVVLVGPWVHYPWLLKRLWQAEGEGEFPEDPDEAAEILLKRKPLAELLQKLAFKNARSRLHYEWVEDGSGLVLDDLVLRMLAKNGLWRFDYTPYLLELEHAPFVIVGDADGTSYPEQAEAVADLAGGELLVLKGAGHYPWLDDPEGFARALYAALDAVAG